MKKVLFVAGIFPPISNSGTQRSAKFTKYLPDFGWQPIVLTSEGSGLPEDPLLLNELVPGTEVIKVPFFSDLLSASIAQKIRFFIDEKRVIEGLSWRLRSFWRVPDDWYMWKIQVVKLAKELFKREPYDCIYATGFPWSSFLAAKAISESINVPYVVDFRDLWTDWDFSGKGNSCRKIISVYLEKKIINSATAVIGVSDYQTETLRCKTQMRRDRFFTITNGFDSKEFINVIPQEKKDNKFRIVYTGVWKENYSPAILYKALCQLKYIDPQVCSRLEVVCAGYRNQVNKYPEIADLVTELGHVSHGEALSLMASADALFLTVAEGDYAKGHIPGKIFEYLASRKKIIVAAPEESEVVNIISSCCEYIRVERNAPEQLAKIIQKNVTAAEGIKTQNYGTAFNLYERSHLTGELAKVFDFAIRNYSNDKNWN